MQGVRARSAVASGHRVTVHRLADHPTLSSSLFAAARYLILTCSLVTVVGLGSRWLAWPLLTSTIGPTAYLFAAHPRTEPARFRNAAVGHAVAIGVGLAVWVSFDLVHEPSIVTWGIPSWNQVIASGVAAGLTMSLLELLHSHHAPAAATALLITTGLARPGPPLIGLVLGLAIVITIGPLCGRWLVEVKDRQPRNIKATLSKKGLPLS
jgi:hypothetical protein